MLQVLKMITVVSEIISPLYETNDVVHKNFCIFASFEKSSYEDSLLQTGKKYKIDLTKIVRYL